jgi:hypothetical protein
MMILKTIKRYQKKTGENFSIYGPIPFDSRASNTNKWLNLE